MASLNKLGKIDWSSKFRIPIGTSYTSRPQMALNLGGLIADGYIAIEAQDSQQVKNIGRDVLTLAKALGVSKDVLERSSSITAFAEQNQWVLARHLLVAGVVQQHFMPVRTQEVGFLGKDLVFAARCLVRIVHRENVHPYQTVCLPRKARVIICFQTLWVRSRSTARWKSGRGRRMEYCQNRSMVECA